MAKRPLHFSTPNEVRAALTKIANEVRNGEITPAVGNCVICAGNAILASIRTDEQERRIADLEATLEKLEGRK